MLFHDTEVLKAISFLQEPLKLTGKFKTSIERATLYLTFILVFVEIRLFNVFFPERKTGFGKVLKKVRDTGFS